MPSDRKDSAFKRFIMLRIVPPVVMAIIRLLYWTWRIRETGREHFDKAVAAPEPAIVAFLHGRTFALIMHMTQKSDGKWVSMCSKSLDGEAMARIEERLGLEVVRGSSGRDGLEAIQEMIQKIRKTPGTGAGLAVDGSRGPRGHVQGGIVRMARWTGGQILPITASASAAHIFRKAWDRTLLPYPFSTVDIVYGEPIQVPSKLNAATAESIRAEVEEKILALQKQADELSGLVDHEPIQAPSN